MNSHIRVVAISALLAVAALASPTTLFSGTSIVEVEDVDAGMTFWSINGGPDHVWYEAWAFRLGTQGGASLLSALGTPTISHPTPDLVTYLYGGAAIGFDIQVRYLLTGDTVTGDVAENLRVRNLSSQPLTISIYEFDDWDMNATIGGDTMIRQNSSTMHQYESGASITVGATRVPDHFEMGSPGDVASSVFGDGELDDIDDTPLTGDDLAWAWRWDFVIAPGADIQISKDKLLVVPEPGTMAIVAGLVGLAAARRRRKA